MFGAFFGAIGGSISLACAIKDEVTSDPTEIMIEDLDYEKFLLSNNKKEFFSRLQKEIHGYYQSEIIDLKPLLGKVFDTLQFQLHVENSTQESENMLEVPTFCIKAGLKYLDLDIIKIQYSIDQLVISIYYQPKQNGKRKLIINFSDRNVNDCEYFQSWMQFIKSELPIDFEMRVDSAAKPTNIILEGSINAMDEIREYFLYIKDKSNFNITEYLYKGGNAPCLTCRCLHSCFGN